MAHKFALFTFAGVDARFDTDVFGGYYDPAVTRPDGSLLPAFTSEAVLSIARTKFNDPATGLISYSEPSGTYVLTQDGESHIYRPQAFEVEMEGCVGHPTAPVQLYQLGDSVDDNWGWKLAPDAPAAKVAQAFCRVLHAYLGEEVMAEVVRKNDQRGDRYDSGICASHDACDANEAMDAAMREVCPGLMDYDCEVGMPEAMLDVWNAAWGYAKAAGFDQSQIPAELLAQLQHDYPAHEFHLVTRDQLSEEEGAHLRICFVHGGTCISDPQASECSRFSVHPTKAYAISLTDARAIGAWNTPEWVSVEEPEPQPLAQPLERDEVRAALEQALDVLQAIAASTFYVGTVGTMRPRLDAALARAEAALQR